MWCLRKINILQLKRWVAPLAKSDQKKMTQAIEQYNIFSFGAGHGRHGILFCWFTFLFLLLVETLWLLAILFWSKLFGVIWASLYNVLNSCPIIWADNFIGLCICSELIKRHALLVFLAYPENTGINFLHRTLPMTKKKRMQWWGSCRNLRVF